MRYALVAFTLSTAIAFAASPALAQSPEPAKTTLLSAAKKHPKVKHHTRPQAASRQIACTVLGCYPIPPQCHPGTGYTLDGIPTGYDVIICP